MNQKRSLSFFPPCQSAVLCVLGLFLAAPASFAAAVTGSIHEPFDYTVGTLFSNPSTLNGGQGWNLTGTLAPNDPAVPWGTTLNGGAAAGTYRTATPGLSYVATGYLPVSGNALTLDALTPNANQNIGRSLGGQVIDSGTTYFSLLMSKNNDTTRTINWAFFNGTSERFAIGQIGASAGNSGGNLALLMNNQNPAGLIQSASPIAMGVGITHLLIGRIDWNSAGFETVTLWVDPTDVTSEGAAGAAYASTAAFELTALTGVRPFVGNGATVGGSPVPGVSANFDEFRLGGSWESVTSLAVVPEPTTAALLGLGAVSLALRRRIGR